VAARSDTRELRDAIAAVVREQLAAERTRVHEREPRRPRPESAGRGGFSRRVARMLDLP
jgi:hypothetical protein